jgi:predicted N-acetyltransferase YhbS
MNRTDIVTRAARPDDWETVADLCGRSFEEPGLSYAALYARLMDKTRASPFFDYAISRVAIVDGRVLGHAQVVPYTMMYGAARLKAGGIHAVCAHPDFRGAGLGSAVMRDGLAYMRDIGCDMAFLYATVEGYYTRFGYTSVWPNYALLVDTAHAARLTPPPGLTVRDLTDDDIPAMLALHAQVWDGRPGARVRDAAFMAWRLAYGYAYRRAAVDATGALRGYLLGQTPATTADDAIAADADATAALLRDRAVHIHDTDTGQMRFLLPPDDPFVRFAKRPCTVEMVSRAQFQAGWMGRILDLHSTLAKLQPELEARLRGSDCADRTGSLRIETDIGTVTLGIRGGAVCIDEEHAPVRRVALPQTALTEMLFGSSTPAEATASADGAVDAGALPLLEALFPPRVSGLAGLDEF